MKTDSSDIHSDKMETEKWQSLLHVCRQWRNVVLGSSRRLNLKLYCTPATPARDTLDVWPALPLIVGGHITTSGTDNIVAALRHRNRVCQVDLSFADRRLEEVLVAMQLPFPELTHMHMGLWSDCEAMPIIPDWFLDGSAPRLRHFELYGIPFPGLPRLLLSATHLVSLRLPNTVFLIPGTFHRKRSPISSPCCHASKHFPFSSNPLNLSLAKLDAILRQNAQSSLL
jgi:hypothetical protein